MKIFGLILVALACAEGRPRRNERVLGSVEIPISTVPYQCSLRRYGNFECGCSILTSTSVLTAAHCVQGQSATSLSVLAGTSDRNDFAQTGFLTTVASYLMYTGFDDDVAGMPDDIAVVTVNSAFNFSNPLIQPLILPSGGLQYTDEVCSVSGWGRFEDPDDRAVFLRQANMSVISFGECHSLNSGLLGRDIFPSQICTFDVAGVKSACDGDDGGPLTCPDGGNQVVAGITSWVAHTALLRCDPTYASVFTRVSDYLQWIYDNAGGVLP